MTKELNSTATLIVDDSEEECQLLCAQLLYVPSVEVIGCVHDGVEAISYLSAVHQFSDRDAFPYPDLMLLDFKMPRCDGMQVLEFLQHHLYRPSIILWSSVVDQIDTSLALDLGADLVCAKPGSLRELAELIHCVEPNTFKRERFSPVERARQREPMHA
jgi:DNA-binding response OmpR family regulator